jgi:hypothetical protein
MSNCPRVFVDFVIVASYKSKAQLAYANQVKTDPLLLLLTFESLVTPEMNVLVLDAVWPAGLRLDMLQAVRLVPAVWENVEGDLPTNGVT